MGGWEGGKELRLGGTYSVDRLVGSMPFRQVECPLGCLVAGFGKGKWEGKKDSEDDKLRLPYTLANAEWVIFENKIIKLLELVNQRRLACPDMQIAYHDLEPDASGPPGAFKLTPVQHINYVPVKQDPEAHIEGGKPPAALQTTVPRHQSTLLLGAARALGQPKVASHSAVQFRTPAGIFESVALRRGWRASELCQVRLCRVSPRPKTPRVRVGVPVERIGLVQGAGGGGAADQS